MIKQMMTKKDFNAIADILFGTGENTMTTREWTLVVALAMKIADHCQRENPNFQRERFLEAAGVVDKV